MNKSSLFAISLGTLAFSSLAMAHGGEYFFVWVLGIGATGAVIGGVAGMIEARKQRHFGFVLLWSFLALTLSGVVLSILASAGVPDLFEVFSVVFVIGGIPALVVASISYLGCRLRRNRSTPA